MKTIRERIDAFKESLLSYLGRDKYNETIVNFFQHSPDWSYLEDRMLSEFSDDWGETDAIESGVVEESYTLNPDELESDMMDEDDEMVFDDEDEEDNEWEPDPIADERADAPIINLRGPEGNIFALWGIISQWNKESGFRVSAIEIDSAMKSGYDKAIAFVKKNFPEIELRD